MTSADTIFTVVNNHFEKCPENVVGVQKSSCYKVGQLLTRRLNAVTFSSSLN